MHNNTTLQTRRCVQPAASFAASTDSNEPLASALVVEHHKERWGAKAKALPYISQATDKLRATTTSLTNRGLTEVVLRSPMPQEWAAVHEPKLPQSFEQCSSDTLLVVRPTHRHVRIYDDIAEFAQHTIRFSPLEQPSKISKHRKVRARHLVGAGDKEATGEEKDGLVERNHDGR